MFFLISNDPAREYFDEGTGVFLNALNPIDQGICVLELHKLPCYKTQGGSWCSRTQTKERCALNKQELIDNMADSADISKAAAGRALDAMISSISGALKKGDSLTLVGFGTFSVRSRAARTGRNPKTGETIQIKAAKVPAFKAGKALKDALN